MTFQENKLHLDSLKRLEEAVQLKKGGALQANIENGLDEGGNRLSEDHAIYAIKEKLRMLRGGIQERRQELRRSAKKDAKRAFSATNFKTGRGRW